MKLRTKIKKLREVPTPSYAKENDAGFDLVAAVDTIIEPGETIIIPTGLAFELAPGYEMQIRPRSGISAKTKLRVVLGTVDAGFRGEVGVIVDNIHPPIYEKSGELAFTDVVVSVEGNNDDITFANTRCFPSGTHYIPAGTRIAQAVISKVEQAHFNVVDELGTTERGEGGFGHTGVVNVDDILKKRSLEAE